MSDDKLGCMDTQTRFISPLTAAQEKQLHKGHISSLVIDILQMPRALALYSHRMLGC